MATILEFQDDHIADFLAGVYPDTVRKLPAQPSCKATLNVSIDQEVIENTVQALCVTDLDGSLRNDFR